MEQFEVKIKISAVDDFEADLLQQGLQNLVEQLGAGNNLLIEIANKQKAAEWGSKIRAMINNPIVKRFL